MHEIKRLHIEQTQKPLLENEYLVFFDEANINHVQTMIKAPYDSVYRHKFIRLDFEIPEDYPFSPPKVYFVNYDSVRIHPNMYEDGKCCSTILNTWPSDNERWTSSMGIETILLTFRSFLDNNPYTFEPGGRDDSTYTDFVLYQSWQTCLFRYIENVQPDVFTEYMEQYIYDNINDIFRDLRHLEYLYEFGYYETRCFEIDLFLINYYGTISKMEEIYARIKQKFEFINYNNCNEELVLEELLLEVLEDTPDTSEAPEPEIELPLDFDCNICFDTTVDTEIKSLECKHTFHKSCLINHGNTNGLVCPLCRSTYSLNTKRELDKDTYIINPETKRRIKIGGKVYQELLDKGVL